MGKERTAEWYDMAKDDEMYICGPEETSYYPMWKWILGHLSMKHDDYGIIELGCGTGQFADLALRLGYNYEVGYDFAKELVRIARGRIPGHSDHFMVKDIFEVIGELPRNNPIICTEVLEHITRAPEIVESMWDKRTFIFSVPSYDAKGHVKTYPKLRDVEDLCNDHIVIEEIKRFEQRRMKRRRWIWCIIASGGMYYI